MFHLTRWRGRPFCALRRLLLRIRYPSRIYRELAQVIERAGQNVNPQYSKSRLREMRESMLVGQELTMNGSFRPRTAFKACPHEA